MMANPFFCCIKDHKKNEDQECRIAFESNEDEDSMFNEDDDCCDDCDADNCSICLHQLPCGSELCTLPCSHKYHKQCIAELHRSNLLQVCPLCRAPLPSPGRDLFNQAVNQYCILEDRVVRGLTSWTNLSKEESEQLAETVELWRHSATQGVKEGWFNLGLMIWFGRGTKQDLPSALSCFLEAAKLNQADAQNNLAFIYEHRQIDDVQALLVYYLAAQQGHTKALNNFGICKRKANYRTLMGFYSWAAFGNGWNGILFCPKPHILDTARERLLPFSTQLSDEIIKVAAATF